MGRPRASASQAGQGRMGQDWATVGWLVNRKGQQPNAHGSVSWEVGADIPRPRRSGSGSSFLGWHDEKKTNIERSNVTKAWT
jgi:hypothetical protein